MYQFSLSSGLFSLPANAQSVDWTVLNDSVQPQTIAVTVFQVGVGPKSPTPPGTLTVTLKPGEGTHNANSVGQNGPFHVGMHYEVVVEANNVEAILPTVQVWDTRANQVIPGTRIGPTEFKVIRAAGDKLHELVRP